MGTDQQYKWLLGYKEVQRRNMGKKENRYSAPKIGATEK
jgi:hypothetical protein